MKTFYVLVALLVVNACRADLLVNPATQTEVDAGVQTRKYVSPATLSHYSGLSGGVIANNIGSGTNLATVSNFNTNTLYVSPGGFFNFDGTGNLPYAWSGSAYVEGTYGSYITNIVGVWNIIDQFGTAFYQNTNANPWQTGWVALFSGQPPLIVWRSGAALLIDRVAVQEQLDDKISRQSSALIVATGRTTLTNGSAIVENSNAKIANRFSLAYYSVDGSVSPLAYSNLVEATSFAITSGNPADTNKVDWMIIQP